jgi:glycosyltransferase involved in cell wall biosynthesis
MKSSKSTLVSVVVPAYNEVENLPELYRQLVEEFDQLDQRLELLIGCRLLLVVEQRC